MIDIRKGAKAIKKIPWVPIGILFLFLLLALLIVKGNYRNQQAIMPTGADIRFEGE